MSNENVIEIRSAKFNLHRLRGLVILSRTSPPTYIGAADEFIQLLLGETMTDAAQNNK